LAALVLFVALPAHLCVAVERDVAGWGWDEAMHGALPAARMLVGMQMGEWGHSADALLGCDRYPFVFPLVLAAGQGLMGIGQDEARWVALFFWFVVGLWGLLRLGQELWADQEGDAPPRRAEHLLVPLALFALAPLPWRYAPSLFLEVPFLVLATHTLASWIRLRRSPGTPAAAVRAGIWMALCVFTKFNYGLLLVGALGVDAIVGWQLATRGASSGPRAAGRSAQWGFWIPLTLLSLWWFAFPWPGASGLAGQHRSALVGFLGGNLDGGGLPWTWRALDFLTGASAHPALVLFAGVGVLNSLRQLSRPCVRTLWLALLCLGVPISMHPFHLDRLLIPTLLPFLVLASVGWIGMGPAIAGLRAWKHPLILGVLLAVGLALTSRHTAARALGLLKDSNPNASRLIDYLDRRQALFGEVPSAGLPRPCLEEILDLIQAKVGPEHRVAWIGMSSELSPGALHLGLLERGGSRARFLSDAHRKMDIVPNPGAADPLAPPQFADPDQRDAFLEETFGGFDWVLTCSPVDLKDRPARQSIADNFHMPLGARLGYQSSLLGSVRIPSGDPDPERAAKEGVTVTLRAWALPEE
jgi:hypothetical protein